MNEELHDSGLPPALSQSVSSRDHAQGKASAPVTLLMYGAYECPHCVEANKTVKEIQKQLTEHLRFVFRHFPRTNVHPHAEAAAEVAEAAGALQISRPKFSA